MVNSYAYLELAIKPCLALSLPHLIKYYCLAIVIKIAPQVLDCTDNCPYSNLYTMLQDNQRLDRLTLKVS